MKNFDAVIIGGGAIGAFSLYYLTTSGVKNCLLIERAPGPGRGASGSWGSLIRATHLNLITTTKAARALSFFHNFKDMVGEDCAFNQCGSLYFFKREQWSAMHAHLDVLAAAGIIHHVIDARVGQRAFPHFNWFDDDLAIFEENAGTACPHLTTESLIRRACVLGATAIFDDSVVEIMKHQDHIIGVRTASGLEISCGHIVVAAGKWTDALTKPLGLTLDVFEKTIQVNRFCRNHFEAKLPLFVDRNLAAFGRFFSDGSFAGGVLQSEHEYNPSARLSITHASSAKMTISKRLNWLKNSRLEGGIRATETYSRDGLGIIGNDFGYRNLVIATGFSCTGFTLAPLAGQDIARLVVE